MGEKINRELFQEIKYEFLEKIAFALITIFTVNPFIRVLFGGLFDYSFLMGGHNRCVLLIGTPIFLLYFVKLRTEEKLPHLNVLLKRHVPVTLLLLFGVLMVATTLLNGAPYIAIQGDMYRQEGLLGFLSYLVYFMITAFMLSEKRKKVVAYLFLISSTLVGMVIFVDYVFLNQTYNYATGADMVMHNSNHLGYYLLISIMFHGMLFVTTGKVWRKVLHIAGFMLMTAALLMNNTWGCQLALVVGVIFTMIVYSVGTGKFQPITLGLVLAMTLTVTLTYVTDDGLKASMELNVQQQLEATEDLLNGDGMLDGSMGSGRMRLWLCTLQYIGERPLLGHGPEVTGERLTLEAGVDRCHCEFLNYAVSFGIPATMVYVVAVFMMYLRGLHKKKQLTELNYVGLGVAFAYLASSAFGNTMYYTAPFLFIALGMGYLKD